MILLTGVTGLLGNALKPLLPFCDKQAYIVAPPRSELDITNKVQVAKIRRLEPHLIIHCAAYTDVAMAERDKRACYETNVIGTSNLAKLGFPMIYISTEYVFDGEKGNYNERDYPNPRNFYALTKLLGEYEARNAPSVVARCLFKPRPFEHEAACVDQWTSGDYVDRMAIEIAHLARIYSKCPETIHIGFEKRTTYDLAKQTKQVIKINREAVGVRIPRDTSLDSSVWKELKRESGLCTGSVRQ